MRTIALLPGSYSGPDDFARHGFAAAAVARGLDDEIVTMPFSASWFADGSIVDRIRAGIVEPARACGARHIWLCGISLGALSAMAYAARHENDLAGLVLLSPYPGTRDVQRDIEQAGGLAAWRPVVPPEGDLEMEAWQWLATSPATRMPVHCFFGVSDRFAQGQRGIAAALDARHVRAMAGGHDWAFWRAAWDAFLDETPVVAA
jgi:pimeloyl-ACP methyl ester carboxylesterase